MIAQAQPIAADQFLLMTASTTFTTKMQIKKVCMLFPFWASAQRFALPAGGRRTAIYTATIEHDITFATRGACATSQVHALLGVFKFADNARQNIITIEQTFFLPVDLCCAKFALRVFYHLQNIHFSSETPNGLRYWQEPLTTLFFNGGGWLLSSARDVSQPHRFGD